MTDCPAEEVRGAPGVFARIWRIVEAMGGVTFDSPCTGEQVRSHEGEGGEERSEGEAYPE